MHDSDILISDTSSIRFDYAFLFNKPVITLDIPPQNLTEFEADDLGENWADEACKKIGTVVIKKNIAEIKDVVSHALGHANVKNMELIRDGTIINWSRSSEAIVEYLLSQCPKTNHDT